MESLSNIINYLKHDKIRNISIINFIENYKPRTIEIIDDGVLARGTSDRDWIYISSYSEENLKNIVNKLEPDDKCFAMIEDWMIPLLTDHKKIKWILSCERVILKEEVEINIQQNNPEVVPLRTEDADYIFNNSHYKEFTSIEYIKDRINNGISAGIYNSNKLIAWAMTHDDGAIGFVHVLEDFRGKGYGTEVVSAMVKALRKNEKIPFACIEEDNIKSMSMFKKLGFSKDRKISWFEIE